MFKVIFFVCIFVAFMIYRMFSIHKKYRSGTPKQSSGEEGFTEDGFIDDDIYSPSSTWHPLNIYRND